jgi:hypothetical protein
MIVQAPLRIVFYGVHVTQLPGRGSRTRAERLFLSCPEALPAHPPCPICWTNRGLDAVIGRSCCLP